MARGDGLVLSAFAQRGQHDKPGQILRIGAESVNRPRAHARTPGNLRTGIHKHVRRVVVDRVGVHRLDDGDVVDDRAGVRQQFAEPGPGSAVLLELENARRDRQSRL